MADQENCVRVTRAAARKRAAESAGLMEGRVMNKKRVVLGDLSNLSNVAVSANKVQGKENKKKQAKGKLKSKTEVAKPTLEVKTDEVSVDKPVDIDAKSVDQQMCGYYVSDIYEYLRQMEADPKRRPLPDYIEKVQKDVSTNMRGILVDWLVEVAEEYKLVSDTLYITVSYIDRYLSLNALNRQRLQLLGVSSMLIASRKYEEINPPNVEDFCYITDNTYRKDEVVKMEADILKSLKFELGNPTVKTFL
ncbi:hypothetical protein Gogos_008427, partial [Gossypium gossypioides]|nr:hypothetical protein [Gossypium gossypioides]